ncbi:MAG TPA: hypothetical protein VH143_25310 [Kofleriaceae bacterium]|jgi:hypothetical protein|nr:hypothetical protein [Kofleriaceae bacterium]
MDEADIYYVDTRNAEPIVVSRTSGGVPVPVSGAIRPTMIGGRPTRVVYPHGVPGNRYSSSSYPSPYMVGSGATLGGSLFGGMTGGQLVDLVAQIFAAVMPLPAGPTATSDPATDVPNLITYQGALAQYAKRDEQIRTLGNLVTKLLG